jgi:hypothetical protein
MWYVVEVELSHHDPFKHILPQITRFSQACKSSETKRKLRKIFVDYIKINWLYRDILTRNKITEEISEFIDEILEQPPHLVVIADEVKKDLSQACEDFQYEKHLLYFETYSREGITEIVPIYRFQSINEIVTSQPVMRARKIKKEREYLQEVKTRKRWY